MRLRRILFALREPIAPFLEFDVIDSERLMYFSATEVSVLPLELREELAQAGLDRSGAHPGGPTWGEWFASLTQFAKVRNCRIVLLTESFTSYARSRPIDWGAPATVRHLAQVWLDIYETSLLAAVSQPDVFQFASLEDFVFARGGFEPRLREAVRAFEVSRHCVAQLDMLRPLAPLSRAEISGYLGLALAPTVRDRIARIDAIRARAVENGRARNLAEAPFYSTSRLAAFEFGSVSNVDGFGPLVRNPALYEGRPIFDIEWGRWLAHAPDPRSGVAEFVYPFLHLIGSYNFFFDIFGRDRRAKPIEVCLSLNQCDSGEAVFGRRFILKPGEGSRFAASLRLEGEYTFAMTFGVAAAENNNYFSGAWVNEARLFSSNRSE